MRELYSIMTKKEKYMEEVSMCGQFSHDWEYLTLLWFLPLSVVISNFLSDSAHRY